MSGQTTRTFGPAYDEEVDGRRVRTQMLRIREYMLGKSLLDRWRSLAEISADLEDAYQTPFPEGSIGAQLRHLKKVTFGNHRLLKRRRAPTRLWEYQLRPPVPPGAGVQQFLL